MEKYGNIEGKVDWKGRPANKNKHGGTRSALLVLGAFGFENMANLALAVNGATYLTAVMHYNLADAANHLTNFMGTSYILSILMAFLADTYVGRFRTVLISSCIEFLGLALLAIQAHYPKLRPPLCNIYAENANCVQIHGGDAAVLFVGLYLVALGTSGIKAALPSHGADQFDENDPKEAKKMPTFFNLLLFSACLGGAISLTVFVWIEDHKGFDWGLGLSAIAMFLSILVLVCGLPYYHVYVVQGSSAISDIIQVEKFMSIPDSVYVAAFKNRKLQLPEDSAELYEVNRDKEAAIEADFLPHTDDFRCLDKAAIQNSSSESDRQNKGEICTVTQVENAKIMLRMIPIFCCTIIMTLCLAQLQTFSVQQGATMDTNITKSFQIPPASLPIIPIVFLIILVPIYDQIIVPFIRRFTGNPNGITYLQRVGVGLILSAASMASAALLEVKRKNVARDHNMLDATPVLEPLPISVFWISIQYFIFGIADMFTYVGLLEFFYSETPKNLKAVSSCFLWSSMALGYYLSSIVVKIVNSATKHTTRSGGWLAGNNINRNHLNLFYCLLSALSIINFIIYLFVAMRYKYRPQKPEIHEGSKISELKELEATHL